MQEILFRGKDQHTSQWVYGHFYTTPYAGKDSKTFDYHFISNPNTYGSNMVIPETVGQFTGLLDKNGKKIFEGDIIKIPDDYDEFGINAGEIYEVYFAFGGFRLKPKHSKAKGFWLEDDKTVEIIGNIHDNPELLEV